MNVSLIFLTLCLVLVTPSVADTTADSTLGGQDPLQAALALVSSERMMRDIADLSSPAFRGRQTGTNEDRDSASFVSNRFSVLRKHRALAPVPESDSNPLPQQEWKQTAPVTMRSIGDDPVLQLTITSKNSPRMVGVDFLPVLDSPSADVHASIVFVGYGISDPAQGIDDYAGVDVRNKIVLFLRGKPDRYTGSATPSDKERIAKEKGALAYLTATGPALSAYEARRGISGKPSAFYSGTPSAHQLPGAWISTPTAEAILRQGSPDSADLRMLQEEANRGQARPVVTDVAADLKWESRASAGHLFNVAWVLRGSSPAADEAVVIGAHRDHFGRQAGLLFAGADDNASGTAVLLEVARVLADTAAAPMRSILFVSFSGEEQGLLGSRLYIAEPIIPLHKTIAMINVDHAGIGNGRLTVGLTGIEKALALKTGQAAGLEDQVDIFGFFPGGDHVPFKEAGVPTVTVVSAGIHPHFHQATDTADTLDPEILRRTARYVLTMAWQLANAPVSIRQDNREPR